MTRNKQGFYTIGLLFFGVIFFTSNKTKATSYTTAVNGHWSNQGCWVNGLIPPFTTSDSIVIKHHIVLPSNLSLLSGASLLIESTGGLCGHFEINIAAGASILKYGILEIDVLNQSGGSVNLLPPGNTIFTQYGFLSGGSFSNTSNFAVGPWFECQMPEYQFLNGINDHLNKGSINIFPNPVEQFIYFDAPNSSNKIACLVFDSKGTLILQKQLSHNQKQIDVSELQSGMFFLQIILDEKTLFGKFYKM